MAKVQYYAAATLDGFIARPDGNLDWLMGYGADSGQEGPMSDGSYDEFYAEVGALAMGSATYEWLLEHAKEWPYELPAWVLTSRELPQPEGGEVTFTNEGAAAVVDAATRAAGGKNVWMVGGGNLASSWADDRLIDEVIVTVVPVFIGEGIPFFARAVEGELRHLNTKTHANGMVELRFAMPQ